MHVVQLGLGAIGLSMTRLLAGQGGLTLTGAVDPAHGGKSLSQMAGLEDDLGITVAASLEAAGARADVAVLATTSRMESITPQVLSLVGEGLCVVSTCEELVYPWNSHPELAGEIDAAAIKAGVAVLSSGVNPGFLMDFLPLIISRMTTGVTSVAVERIQDAAPRRAAFQQKIGAGLTQAEFEKKVTDGNFGHAGLLASLELLADGLGWELEDLEETIAPVLAERDIDYSGGALRVGDVAGLHQEAVGFLGGKEVLTLTFQAAVGEPESFDRIEIDGAVPLMAVFPGGVPGDAATGAIIVNAIPLVKRLPPGLRTMADLWPAVEHGP